MVTPRSLMLRISCTKAWVSDGVHAGDRLVEQQHRRLGRQRQRDADKPLLAVGQRARKIMGAAFEADPFDQLAGAFPQAPLRRPRARQAQNGFEKADPALTVQPDQQIVVNGVVRKHAGALEGADQAEVGDLVRLQAVERRTAIADGAVGSDRRKPVTTLKAVVLPAPLGPIRLTISPSPTEKFMSESATSPPKCTATFS